jgi:hypothetical protein
MKNSGISNAGVFLFIPVYFIRNCETLFKEQMSTIQPTKPAAIQSIP